MLNSQPLSMIFESPVHPSFSVRVRGLGYLWGSASLGQAPTFSRELVMHIRNDPEGQSVEISTSDASGTLTPLVTLAHGEAVSIPITNICGIAATCINETIVSCQIH